MVVLAKQREEDFADPIITNFVKEDHVPWYKKKNLRSLYFFMYPACTLGHLWLGILWLTVILGMGIEITSGFDSQIINVVQIVPSWQKCKESYIRISQKSVWHST